MRVLIVDDSRAMRMIVKRTLRQAGFGDLQVEEAANGQEALSRIEEHRPDLVLSDWNMPEMSGIELLEKLRADGDRTKLGFVTSQGTAEMRTRAVNAGALFFITKPFTGDTFKQTLGPVLSC